MKRPLKSGKAASRRSASLLQVFAHPLGKVVFGVAAAVFLVGFGFFAFEYYKYAKMTDAKLAEGPFTNTSKLFGAPQVLSVGDEVSSDEIVSYLHRAGYGRVKTNPMGWYQADNNSVEVFPGRDSYFQDEPGVIRFERGRIARIISLRDSTERTQYLLEPELITNLFDRKREKRRLVRFVEVPPVMVKALTSAEDKRFWNHAGFDPLRILKVAYIDIREGRHAAGASTLSMQLARSLWLTTERTWRRKWPEFLITLHLERKLTKEEIFEHYANQIYLGRIGSFNIHGFGEGAQTYFGKDLRTLNLPEAALLAGIIQSPSRYNPLANPERAKQRRNVVLMMMRDNGHITEEEYRQASEAPLGVKTNRAESDDAPYFVDLVHSHLQSRFQDHDFQANSYRVYTTLDMNLQRAAAESVRIGMKEVDELLKRRGRTPERGWQRAQAALVALDARTGEVKALVGGRHYGESQLNRTLSRRPPGSIFKPFVYAATLSRAAEGYLYSVTPASVVMDEPTTFWYDDKPYEPNNYRSQFNGEVTMRQALIKSLNIPTVKFAEMAGYDAVVRLAKRAGMNDDVKATPAVALGAYEVRPLEIAGSYTIFSNKGVYEEPDFIGMIRDQHGRVLHRKTSKQRKVLDPRVAYILTNLMEDVLWRGTGAGARARGFRYPAAGKTGTSHDGWFAGYTTELICVVWVGFDDNRELGLEGAKSALPIWTEFMKRAHEFRPYRRATTFSPPDGVVTVEIDEVSGKLAGSGCLSRARNEVFIAGTEPLDFCGGSSGTRVVSWDMPESSGERGTWTASRRRNPDAPPSTQADGGMPTPEAPEREEQPRRKGIFGRILDKIR